jgi:hypothetical protein
MNPDSAVPPDAMNEEQRMQWVLSQKSSIRSKSSNRSKRFERLKRLERFEPRNKAMDFTTRISVPK